MSSILNIYDIWGSDTTFVLKLIFQVKPLRELEMGPTWWYITISKTAQRHLNLEEPLIGTLYFL